MTEPATAPLPPPKKRRALLPSTALALALAALIWLWLATPPQAARLLPECDALIYANLAPLRAATHFDRKPVRRSPDFQHFIDATGILPERDLDTIALALHRLADPTGPNGPVAYSEVFSGHFDSDRLDRYLAASATSRDTYAGHTLYSLPMGDLNPGGQRQLRIAILAPGLIAASNAPTPEQIHAILDRHRSTFNLFSGPTLLTSLYSEIPTLASAWAIGQLGLPFAAGNTLSAAGLNIPFSADTHFIVSIRYAGRVELRVQALAYSPDQAANAARQLTSLLALFRSIESSRALRMDPTLQQGLDSLQIRPIKDRVQLTANLPAGLLDRLFTPDPQAPPPAAPASK